MENEDFHTFYSSQTSQENFIDLGCFNHLAFIVILRSFSLTNFGEGRPFFKGKAGLFCDLLEITKHRFLWKLQINQRYHKQKKISFTGNFYKKLLSMKNCT